MSKQRIISIIFLLFVSGAAFALGTLRGVTTRVASGDRLAMTVGGKTYAVALAEIDAPERGQAYAQQSREALSGLTLNEAIEVIVIGNDAGGRLVGRVFAGMTDVNAELVRLGLAWVNPETVRDPVLVELEKIARREKRGLWHDPYAIPPWDWRDGQRRVRSPDAGPVPASAVLASL